MIGTAWASCRCTLSGSCASAKACHPSSRPVAMARRQCLFIEALLEAGAVRLRERWQGFILSAPMGMEPA